MLVSVVVPAYNAEESLALCLAALCAQQVSGQQVSGGDLEIIVVDDGSTDRTGEIIGGYPVRAIHQPNQGPAAARNHGAEEAKGDILLFTDADCVPDPDWMEQMVAPFEDGEVVAVKGAYRTRQPQLTARFAQLEFEERFELLERAGRTDMVDTYSAGYRRHRFLELGGFDCRFPVANNEDTELSYRMAARGWKMVFTPRAIVYHLGHPDSPARYARLKFSRGYWRMVVYRLFPGKMLKDTYTPKTLKFQILTLFLLFVSMPTLLVGRGFGLLPLAPLLLFCLSAAPFTLTALGKDRQVGLSAPLFLALRAGAIGCGALWGAWHGRLGAVEERLEKPEEKEYGPTE